MWLMAVGEGLKGEEEADAYGQKCGGRGAVEFEIWYEGSSRLSSNFEVDCLFSVMVVIDVGIERARRVRN